MCNQTCVFDVCVSFLCVYREACVCMSAFCPNEQRSIQTLLSLQDREWVCLWIEESVFKSDFKLMRNVGIFHKIMAWITMSHRWRKPYLQGRCMIVSDFSAISMIYQPDTDYIQGNVSIVSWKNWRILISLFWILASSPTPVLMWRFCVQCWYSWCRALVHNSDATSGAGINEPTVSGMGAGIISTCPCGVFGKGGKKGTASILS